MSEPAENMTAPAMEGTTEGGNDVDLSQPLGTVPAPAPEPSPIGEDWRSVFGEEGQGLTFKTPADMLKSYNEAQGMIRRSIRIPTEDASAEVQQAFYDKLQEVPGVVRMPYDEASQATFNASIGVPENPEGYNWTEVEGFHNDATADAEFRSVAHSLGMNTKQADGIRQYLANHVVQGEQMMNQSVEQQLNELRTEWGLAYDSKAERAEATAAHMAKTVDGFGEWLQAGHGRDPMVIKLMATIADMGGEAGPILSDPAGAMTPYDAKMQIKEIRDNPNHPFNIETDPAHNDAIKKVQELYHYAYPDRK
jgi:hypothetical protein